MLRFYFFATCLIVCVLGRSMQRQPLQMFKWTRKLEKYGIDVTEWAAAGPDFIYMASEDNALEKTDISKTTSFHDYVTNYVALRSYDRVSKTPMCFISKISKDYDTTIQELEDRNGKVHVRTEKPHKYVTDTKTLKGNELFKLTGSDRLARFCRGTATVPVWPENSQQGPEIVSKRNPRRAIGPGPFPTRPDDMLLCIWYPWDIKVEIPPKLPTRL